MILWKIIPTQGNLSPCKPLVKKIRTISLQKGVILLGVLIGMTLFTFMVLSVKTISQEYMMRYAEATDRIEVDYEINMTIHSLIEICVAGFLHTIIAFITSIATIGAFYRKSIQKA